MAFAGLRKGQAAMEGKHVAGDGPSSAPPFLPPLPPSSLPSPPTWKMSESTPPAMGMTVNPPYCTAVR